VSTETILSHLRRLAGSRGSLRGQLVRGGTGSALILVINRLLTLTLGIVMARGLGAKGYGVYAYAFALMTLLMVFAEMGMPTLLMREVAASEARQDWPHLRGVLMRALQIVFTAAVTLAAIAALVLWVSSVGMSVSLSKTLIWVIVLLPLMALTKVMMAAVRGLQHVVKAKAVEMLVRPVLFLLGLGFLFSFFPDMRLPQYAMAVHFGAAIAVLCAAAVLLYRYLPRPARATAAQYQTRQWLASAMPLTLMGGAGIINNQTDILMLGFFRAPEDVGIYRVAVQGAVLVAFGLQAANAVIAPQFARLYAQGDEARLQRLVTVSARIILLVALPVALTFILAGGAIAIWVFGSEFARSHTSLAILATGQMINAAMGSVGFLLNMTGHERDTARTLLITAVMNVLLNLLLIPPFGMAGAASATAISLVAWNILLCRLVMVRIGINSTAFALNRN
jgi:O-antigen/teichoic acid export membrane protein